MTPDRPLREGDAAAVAVGSAVRATRLLCSLWAQPGCAVKLSPDDWREILGAARRARCLGHLGSRLASAGALHLVPPRVVDHLESTTVLVARRRRALRWELRELAEALDTLPHPVVALKGAAYEIEGLPLALARYVSDTDLLVPLEGLAAVEARLKSHGWVSAELSDYDERYYREWSHEIPPMVHPSRAMEVDVHHSIAPGISGDSDAARSLIRDSLPVRWTLPGVGRPCDRLRVLSPVDQLVHLGIHTFAGSELSLRLREVMDFDLLYRHRCIEQGSLDANDVLARAAALNASRPVYWMLHFAARWLGTPVAEALRHASARPGAMVRRVMEANVDRAMLPGERLRRSHSEFAAEMALLGRYQWQRLPLRRLVPHLVEKGRRRLLES